MESGNLTAWIERLQNPGQWALIGLLLLGLACWLLGRKLARPACAATGMAIGGLLTLVISQAIGDGGMLLVWLIAGCILGATVAWLLFRVWMGITCALVLAVILPPAVLAWQDAARPQPDAEPAQVQPQALAAPLPETPDAPDQATNLPPEPTDPINQFQYHLRKRYQAVKQQVTDWWHQQPPSRQRTMLMTGLTSAGVGLVGGIALPYLMASITSALLGSVLVVYSASQLVTHWTADPGQWLPQRPAVYALVIFVGAAVGVLLQWTIFRGERER